MIVVLGCGVSGLSCALALLRAGYDVELWARERPPNVTSSIAAAMWYPYRVPHQERVVRWAADSYTYFRALEATPRAGVTIRRVYDLAREPAPRPWWASAVDIVRQATRDELPPGFSFGWVFDAPVIDTRVYLPYLIASVEALGGRFVRREVRHLAEASTRAAAVVNCTGLGAASLCDDAQLFPIRGQLVQVSDPGLQHILLDEHGEQDTYIIPRGDDCVLGATADEDDDDLTVRPLESERIVERAIALAPALQGSTLLAEKVGLRPGRSSVRLEVEHTDVGPVVHDYGHGGAGVTLSWGCAQDVLALVREHVPAPTR